MTREDVVKPVATHSALKAHTKAVKAVGDNQHYTILMMMQGGRPVDTPRRRPPTSTRRPLWTKTEA